MQALAGTQDPATITVRPLRESDLGAADHIMRVAFGTYLGAPDPVTVFGDASYVKTRFLAAPDCAWAAEIDGEVSRLELRHPLGLIRVLRAADRARRPSRPRHRKPADAAGVGGL
jgi:hypothetical protein